MKLVFAFECYADRDVFRFLRETGSLPLKELHAFGQGEVVKAIATGKATIGMVDEDPRRTHHRLRDAMRVVRTTGDFELRESSGRYLGVLRPELEGCFLRAANLLGIRTKLPREAPELRRLLNRPNSSAHGTFVNSLGQIYAEARSRRESNFLTELAEMLERVPTK